MENEHRDETLSQTTDDPPARPTMSAGWRRWSPALQLVAVLAVVGLAGGAVAACVLRPPLTGPMGVGAALVAALLPVVWRRRHDGGHSG
jgi:hypothetical protein